MRKILISTAGPEACNLLKKELRHRGFSEIFKKTCFNEHERTTDSEKNHKWESDHNVQRVLTDTKAIKIDFLYVHFTMCDLDIV